MIYRRILSLWMVLVVPFVLAGQSSLTEQIARMDNNGEVYLRFTPGNNGESLSFPSTFSIDRTGSGNSVYGYAVTEIVKKWIADNPSGTWEVLPHPSTLVQPVMKDKVDIQEIDEWDFYPTYEAYADMMFQFEEAFPELCQVVSIGQSEQGRELLAVVITDPDEAQGEEPLFLYTATIHGDETAGYVLFLRLIDHLLNEYGSDPLITELVDNLEIWINPLSNPDGTYAGGNQSVYGATRFNSNGVDLNRNYPDPEDGQHPDGNPWQAETEHFMALAENHSFLLSANIHGGSEVFNYPWDTWSQLPADDDWWNFVGREWVDTVYAHAPAGYFSGFNNGVSNGYQWYTISGGRQDYMNYFAHCREFTLEISNTKLLPANLLPQFWEYNYRSFLNYMKQSLYGFQGKITDAQTGDPLMASVFIESHDIDRSWVKSNASGRYFRPVYEGTYDLTFYRPGYALKTIESQTVSNYSVTEVNVQLEPTNSNVGMNSLSNQITIGGNPGNGLFSLVYHGQDPADLEFILLDGSGKTILEDHLSTDSGNASYSLDIQGFASGMYYLYIKQGRKRGTFSLIKQ